MTIEGLDGKFDPEFWNYAKTDLRRIALTACLLTRLSSWFREWN